MIRYKAFGISLGVIWATMGMGISAAHAAPTDRYVATNGEDTSDCSDSGNPCLTPQYAVDQAADGDTVHFAAGEYLVGDPGTLFITMKTLTLLGAQAGVDARTRAGAETVLRVPNGVYVDESGVVIDGFTIQDASGEGPFGFGVLVYSFGNDVIPPVNGTRIVNNIIQDNVTGVGLSNAGTVQAVIQHNLFKNNNLPGFASGDGIYVNEFIGVNANVLIDANDFVGQNGTAVAFASQDTTRPNSDITVTNNTMDGCGNGLFFYSTQRLTVKNNTIKNLVVPASGDTSTAIGILGADSDFTIEDNNLDTGPGYGIRIANLLAPNSNIQIHENNIAGFALAGLNVDEAPTGADDYATCNWWGDSSGPANPTLNPDGTGDAVLGDVLAANFNPWLIAAAPEGQCGEEPPPCCETDGGTTYSAEMGDASCIICTDSGPVPGVGSDASTDASADAASSVANGSDNTSQDSQDSQGSGGNNPTPSSHGASSSDGGCQVGAAGASNTGLGMMAGLFAMVAGAWRRRRKVVQG